MWGGSSASLSPCPAYLATAERHRADGRAGLRLRVRRRPREDHAVPLWSRGLQEAPVLNCGARLKTELAHSHEGRRDRPPRSVIATLCGRPCKSAVAVACLRRRIAHRGLVGGGQLARPRQPPPPPRPTPNSQRAPRYQANAIRNSPLCCVEPQWLRTGASPDGFLYFRVIIPPI